ncbi:MAG: response regulator [Candidatus Nitrosocosmicus sp.]
MPLSILIVDDEVDLGLLLKQFLDKQGFDAIYFSNPLLAFEHLKNSNSNYCLIIADLRMPGLSGIDLSIKIRTEINPSIKIFLITAFDIADLKDNSDFISAKIERIIQKPIKLSSLRQIISQTFQKQSLEHQR